MIEGYAPSPVVRPISPWRPLRLTLAVRSLCLERQSVGVSTVTRVVHFMPGDVDNAYVIGGNSFSRRDLVAGLALFQAVIAQLPPHHFHMDADLSALPAGDLALRRPTVSRLSVGLPATV